MKYIFKMISKVVKAYAKIVLGLPEKENGKLRSKQLGKGLTSKQKYVSANWQAIYNDLKSKGYTLRSINKMIGSNFRNQVYSGYNMDYSVFEKLQSITGSAIEHSIIEPQDRYQSYKFEKNRDVAEAIGIVLGDGHLVTKELTISLNGEKEQKYVKYVNRFLRETFQKKPANYPAKDSKAHKVVFNSKGIIDELVNLGLQKGHKVKNQVGVPDWIKENREFSRACVKGLFDTDGCISFTKNKVSKTRRINLSFCSVSKPLLDFFYDFCTQEGIRPNGPYGPNIAFGSRYKVTEFADLIQSEKIKNFLKRHNLGYDALGKSTKY
ncbi:MAG: hypothetical protein HeimC2_21280 [Candidatus Heimdallarchaeota archaeon LC_2]|nr:MAG: hypothetical protein HeimC2_21280 [Candidatus Heimdallarchaeota archaeon LC_2]